jgi:energy-coupling factor transporter ATP-binding protein EcfA2
MYIEKISINYFKFFTNSIINLDQKNALIYGENGSGKSSLYYALYRVLRNRENFSNFKNFYLPADTTPSIQIFGDNEIQLKLENDYPFAFFINYLIINKIFDFENFFIYFEKFLKINFPRKINPIFNKIKEIKENISNIIDETIRIKVQSMRKELKDDLEALLSQIQNKANEILIKMEVKVSLQLSLEKETEIVDDGTTTFIKDPIIIFKINEKENIKTSFNEAILKIAGLAIWFALIELEENEKPSTEEDLKLLVLDDILMSIDMGNRLFFAKYLFESDLFSKYQIIFMTHSIEFYKMLSNYIDKVKESKKHWLYIAAYGQEEVGKDFNSSVFINLDSDYINDAEKNIKDKNFQNAGNALRKELEKQIKKLSYALGEGKEYQMSLLLQKLTKRQDYYLEPQSLLDELLNDPNNKEFLENKRISIEKINLSNLKFINELILNKYSHDDARESYSNELKITLDVIKALKNNVTEILDGKKKEMKK